MFSGNIPQLNAPIVLVHGLCGYDRLSMLGRTVKDYFPGIREKLEAAGNRVLIPRLSRIRGITIRAAELKRFIERCVPSGPVHLIGHSLGGLDSRYMIAKLGMAERVLSLTTIGTPQWGTASSPIGASGGSPVADSISSSCSGCRVRRSLTSQPPRVGVSTSLYRMYWVKSGISRWPAYAKGRRWSAAWLARTALFTKLKA